MNKQYILLVALVSCTLANCKKETIKTYDSGEFVQFTKIVTDTVSFSFFFYPGQPTVDVALPVKLIGNMPTGDLHYKISAAQDDTNAPADIFSIPTDFTFRKGLAVDTAHITIKNKADLATKTYMLVLQIANADNVKAGQSNYARRVFKINDMISRPLWWDATNESLYLGKYTEKKFRTFIAVTGIGDVSSYSSYEQRDMFLKFKNYLISMKDKGTPVLEDDGTDMLSTVPLIG